MGRKYNRVILTALALLLLAGCTTAQTPQAERIVEVVTATPAPTVMPAGPTVTLADPNASVREMANNLYFVEQTSTAEARNAMATQLAYERAQADATSAALALTLQVEEYNAGATAYANSAAATATTQALALERDQTDATATARAEAVEDAYATQEAARAKELETEAKETERKAGQADLDRQTGHVAKIAIVSIATIAAAIVLWHYARFLSLKRAIYTRRQLIMEQAGLYIDAQTGEPRALPGFAPAPALAAPGDEPTRAERLRAAIKPDAMDAAFRASERQVRQAWKLAALGFLRWTEHVPRGEDAPVGFSRRRLCAAASISEDTYHVMVGFLSDLALIEKETGHPNSSWVLARGRDGQPMTVTQALKHTVWLTSFDAPNVPALPEILPPPVRNYRHHTTPHQPHHTTPHQDTSEKGVIEGEFRQKTSWNMSLDYGPDDLPDDGDAAEAG
jgi:hypothetical protein